MPEKPDNAKADTSVREENPGDKQTKPEVKVTQRVYGSGNKSWLADRKKEDAEKNCRRKRRLRQYVRTEVRRNIRCGTVFGLYVDDIYDTDKYIRHVCSAAFDRTSFSGVFLLSFIFGLNAIYTFKKARSYGVKPIATLIFGILGTIEAALLIFAVLILFFSLGG